MDDTTDEKTMKCSIVLIGCDSSCRFHAPSALGLMALFQLSPSCGKKGLLGQESYHRAPECLEVAAHDQHMCRTVSPQKPQ